MANFWESWETPWTPKQCERRYVEGQDAITLKKLSEASGQRRVQIEYWSSKFGWVKQRQEFQEKILIATRERALEKTADLLSDEVAAIATANYTVAKMFRDYAAARMQIYMRDMQRILMLPEDEQLAATSRHSLVAIDTLGKIASRAMADIAANTGLQYEIDVNSAIVRVEKEGFVIADPGDN